MQPIKAKKLSDAITEQLESMILDGSLLAGDKLPSERDLAERFAVSRPSVREAMQKLQAKGLVYRKQGGGTYIKHRLTEQVTDPLIALIAERPETQFDLLEFRHVLEGMAAYYAALRGQQADDSRIQQAIEQVNQSRETNNHDKQQEAAALANFYLCLAEAAHNVVLLHVMRSLHAMLQENIRCNLLVLNADQQANRQIIAQRQAIVDAVLARDPQQARQASNEHLRFIEQTLLTLNQQDSRMQRALRRIQVND